LGEKGKQKGTKKRGGGTNVRVRYSGEKKKMSQLMNTNPLKKRVSIAVWGPGGPLR